MSELFLSIVNMSISASWLVLAVLVLRLMFGKAPKWIRLVLWGMVAVRLLCPFSPESAFSLLPSSEIISPEIMMSNPPEIHSGIPAVNSSINPVLGEFFTPAPGDSANPLQIWIPVLAGIWVIGMVVLAGYTAVSYWRLHRRVSMAVLFYDNIYQSGRVASPFVFGIRKPKIYLPLHMEKETLDYVLAHEQAHIRRRDHWWKALGFLLLIVHWFNPVLWLAYVLLGRDIELACDERVIKELKAVQRADYSQALLSFSVNQRRILACPLAFGEVSVKERVKNVLNYRKPALWMILLALVACVVTAVCFLTNPQAEKEVETTRRYVFTESEDFIKPSVTLDTNGQFSFGFSAISSYLGFGTYEIENDRLTMRTYDGLYVYVFDIVEDAILFDAEASSKQTWFSKIYDGAVFDLVQPADDKDADR